MTHHIPPGSPGACLYPGQRGKAWRVFRCPGSSRSGRMCLKRWESAGSSCRRRVAELGAGAPHRPRPGAAGRPRRGGRSCYRFPPTPPLRGDCGPFLSPRSLWLPLTRLSCPLPSRAMASALSYVSKFKSFVILFFTPLLLLPLIILMPAKVSCISGQPRGLQAPGPSSGHRTREY